MPRDADRLSGSPGLADDRRVVVDDRDVVAGAVQLLGDEAADAAASGDDDPHVSAPSSTGACSAASTRSRRSASTARYSTSPAWATVRGVGDRRRAHPVDRHDAGADRLLELGERLPGPAVGERALDEADAVAVGSVHSAGAGVGSSRRSTWSVVHATVATVGMPEPLVDHGPARVVDAGDDVLDAEVLPGDAGDEDVGVVAVGDGGERAGLARCRPRSGGRGRTRCPARCVPAKSAPSRCERVGPPVDDGDGVAVVGEGAGRATTRPDRIRRSTTCTDAECKPHRGPADRSRGTCGTRSRGDAA